MKQLTFKPMKASFAALPLLFVALALLVGMAGGARAQTYAPASSFSTTSNAANFGQAANFAGNASIQVSSPVAFTTTSSETL